MLKGLNPTPIPLPRNASLLVALNRGLIQVVLPDGSNMLWRPMARQYMLCPLGYHDMTQGQKILYWKAVITPMLASRGLAVQDDTPPIRDGLMMIDVVVTGSPRTLSEKAVIGFDGAAIVINDDGWQYVSDIKGIASRLNIDVSLLFLDMATLTAMAHGHHRIAEEGCIPVRTEPATRYLDSPIKPVQITHLYPLTDEQANQ